VKVLVLKLSQASARANTFALPHAMVCCTCSSQNALTHIYIYIYIYTHMDITQMNTIITRRANIYCKSVWYLICSYFFAWNSNSTCSASTHSTLYPPPHLVHETIFGLKTYGVQRCLRASSPAGPARTMVYIAWGPQGAPMAARAGTMATIGWTKIYKWFGSRFYSVC